MNGLFELDQAKALKKAGNDVVLLATDIRSILRWRTWGFEQRILDGIPVLAYNIPLGRVPYRLRHTAMRFAVKKLFSKAARQFGHPDIVHAHFYHVGYVCGQVKSLFQCPLIITEHSSKMATGIDQKTEHYASMAYAQADGVICVSRSLQEILRNVFSVDAVCIPNIVDTSLFKIGCPSKSGFHFVSTGALINRKGHDVTIRAFAQAFAQTGGVFLTIFGEGPERTDLEKLIESLHLTGHVQLAGLQSRECIAEKLKNSDCFVLCSRGETFGVAYIEAMACGLPVIATRCHGPEDFVTDENGVLIDMGSVTEAANAMRHFVEQGRQYNKRNISKKTRDQFSGSAIAKKLMYYYNDLLKRRNV